MKKIKFTIKKDILIIDYKIENNDIKNINNTNIITDEDLIFDTRYLKNNLKLVAGFINVIVQNEHTTKAIVCNEELVDLSLDILNLLPTITYLKIVPDIAIDYKMHMAILRNDTIKEIDCYTIPTYLLERIDTTKNIKIKTRNEVFFISNFLRLNHLTNYSDVYYKKKVTILSDFNESDWKDFDIFLSINKYLKIIYFDYITMDLIKDIVKYLKKYNKSNIKINILGNEKNLKNFNALENYVKKNKFIKKYKIKFRIDYTKEYQKENFIKLLNFTTIRYILIVIIISSLLGYGLNQYNIFKSSEQIDHINDNLNDIVESTTRVESIEQPAESSNNIDYQNPYYQKFSEVISVLRETNPDTVGWLHVPNTTVNYPVVQSTNNSYYLTHDFNKNPNSLGWVFMDYRNNSNDLNKNTILYGHNIARAKLMFGDLKRTLDADWYQNKNNQYITFNTITGNKRWRIFSIYKVQATNDYLYNSFGNDDAFLSFVNKMKERSIYDFGVNIKPTDKILTLSTCQTVGSTKGRLVIHAVLIN